MENDRKYENRTVVLPEWYTPSFLLSIEYFKSENPIYHPYNNLPFFQVT